MQALKKYLIPFLYSVTGIVFSQSPSFNFQKLGSEEGLNNANIFSIQQHNNGLMYFTTQNGVYFYDGYRFQQLRIDSLKSNTLLHSVLKDDETLNFSIRGEGIAEYKAQTNAFRFPPLLRFNNNADQLLLSENYIYALTSGIKLTIIELSTGKIIPDELRQKNRLNQAYCIYRSRSGKLLLGRSDGLYELVNGRQIKINLPKKIKVHSIAENSSGELVLGTENKFLIVKNTTILREVSPRYQQKSSTFLMGGEKSINKLLCDDFGRIWFTAFPDENIYLLQNNQVYDVFELLGIAPSLINCIYKDRENNIWVGTYNDGVYLIQNSFFNSIQFLYKNKNLSVNEVFLKDNLLVAATGNGLFGLNLTNNATRILSEPDEVFMEPISGLVNVNGTIFYSKRSQFNMRPALFFDSKNSYKLQPVIARLFYPINAQQSILADWNANILLCNSDGSKTIDTLISFPDYRITVNALYKKDEVLYVATSNGLYEYDFAGKRYRNVVSDALNYNINDITLVNGKLYVAHEAGITELNDSKLIQQIGQFRLNSVKKIKLFKDRIWLATLDGVLICDVNFKPLHIINKSTGLLSNTVNDISISNGMLGIATVRGVATTPVQNIERFKTTLNPVSIQNVMCQGKALNITKGTYYLNSNQDNISIQFFSPLYTRPNKQYFKYKLNAEAWREFNDLSLNISLSGGQHIISIIASADNINWSEASTITLVKQEKFSEQQSLFWIVLLGGLVLVTLISVIWIRRVKRIAKMRLKQEQQINELKHQAMNSLLSPHFIFNSLTSIQNYINTNDSLRASEYLAKFSRLIRLIIEKAAQREISLHDELSRLTYYLELEKERFKNKFDYDIIIDATVKTEEILIPNMIIQPYVENCILHGILPKNEPGKLRISFQKSGNLFLKISIEDDGIGLMKASEKQKSGHKSIATGTIKTILDINSKLSGKKQVVSMTDKSTLNPNQHGTLIEIVLEL
ncbi:MAG: histidine kinase [Bacteroidia bacterium]|nr:histidine kinase [Bacteroidia bacterium]